MWPRPLAPLLALVALSACGSHTISVEGRTVDTHGAPVAGVVVTLGDPGTPGVATSTDGRFTIGFDVPDCFMCDVGTPLDLHVGPDGAGGATLGQQVFDLGHDAHTSLGDLHLPASTEATLDGDSLLLALDPAVPGVATLVVDGLDWIVPSDGVLPAAALAPCNPGVAVCDHELALTWFTGADTILTTAATVTLHAAGPSPIVQTLGPEIGFPSPIAIGDVFIDWPMLLQQANDAPSTPVSGVLQVKVGADIATALWTNLAEDACSTYGSGLRCTVALSDIVELRVLDEGSQDPIRVFAPAASND